MIAQDLWQAHFQSLLIVLLRKLTANRIKCQYGHDNAKCETCGIKYKDCECCLEYKTSKDDLILCECLGCNRNYQFGENVKKQFANTYRFSYHDINKFLLL